MTELQIMMQGMTEEQQERIYKQADRLEAYFDTNGDVHMKDTDGWDGNDKLPNGDGKIIK